MSATLEIFSDFICPWCLVVKPRLAKAVDALGKELGLEVVWRPYELNPTMPKEGMDRKVYRSRKFGDWGKSLALDAQVTAAGAREGIPFDFAQIERTPNTLDAHRLMILARKYNRQTELSDAIFKGYFTEGKDIGDCQTLVGLAEAAGLDPAEALAYLESNEGEAEVAAQEFRARQLGINSVPTFVLNGEIVTSGALTPERLAAAIRQSSQAASA